jgi:hypothetical protein
MSERTIGKAELVRQLGVSPRLVRELLREYHGWLSQPDSGQFTALDLARLQIAARGRLSGRTAREIENQLVATRKRGEALPEAQESDVERNRSEGEAAAAREADLPAGENRLSIAAELVRLQQTIADSAEHERRDRDRMLTTLMRTQMEVAHLREELGTYRTRASRKRGLMRWLRG